jgi:hypothetical protein
MRGWMLRSIEVLVAGVAVAVAALLLFTFAVLKTHARSTATANILWSAGIIVTIGAVVLIVSGTRREFRVLAVMIAAIGLGAAGLYQYNFARIAREQRSNVWWQEASGIEQYLLRQTPIGTSEERVVNWLQGRAVALNLNRDVAIRRSSANQIDAVVNIYTEDIFQVWVSGVYTFDASHGLIAIKVTKHVDAP